MTHKTLKPVVTHCNYKAKMIHFHAEPNVGKNNQIGHTNRKKYPETFYNPLWQGLKPPKKLMVWQTKKIIFGLLLSVAKHKSCVDLGGCISFPLRNTPIATLCRFRLWSSALNPSIVRKN